MTNQYRKLTVKKPRIFNLRKNQVNYRSHARTGMLLLFLAAILSGLVTVFSLSRAAMLSIAGSTTLLPLLNTLSGQYEKTKPGTNIAIQGGGSSLGISYLNRQLVNASSESRYPTKAEYQKKHDWAKQKIVTYLIGGDLIVFVANLNNLVQSDSSVFFTLGIDTLNDIYAGVTKNWGDVNGINKQAKVTPINRELGSGTRNVVYSGFGQYQGYLGANSYCSKISRLASAINFPKVGLVATSNGEALSWLTSTTGSIGYVSFPYLKSIMNDSFIKKGLRIINPIAINKKKNTISFLPGGFTSSNTFSTLSLQISNSDNFTNAWLNKNKFVNPPYLFIHPLCVSGKQSDVKLQKFMSWYLPTLPSSLSSQRSSNNKNLWCWFGKNCAALKVKNYIPIISLSSNDKGYKFHPYGKSAGTVVDWKENDTNPIDITNFKEFTNQWRQPSLPDKCPWWYNYFVSWTT